MTSPLKPCPFCGKPPIVDVHGRLRGCCYDVQGFIGGIGDTDEDRWNSRPRESALRARLDEAMGMLRRLEWAGDDGDYACCPECQGLMPSPGIVYSGHSPTCALARILEGEK